MVAGIAPIEAALSLPHILILGLFVSIPIAVIAIVVALIVWMIGQRDRGRA